MTRTLVTLDGTVQRPSDDEVRALPSDGSGYWLDIEDPGDDDFALLLDGFHFHPLTVDDVRVQNQRPKLDHFTGYAFAVLFTAGAREDELVFQEHHLYLVFDHGLVTIHDRPSPPLDALRDRLRDDPTITRGMQGFLNYLVINQLVESLFPVLDSLDERIDTLEDSIVEHPEPDTLARISDLKHSVTDLRRILSPQRDVFSRLLTHSLDKQPGDELSLYWRDVYEHLTRQYEQADSLRDLLSGTMDIYLSTVSNRLNGTMKQLTVIASLFLPLTFLTGFFGMNFGVLVGHIGSPAALFLGVTVMLLGTVLQLAVFRVRGWI